MPQFIRTLGHGSYGEVAQCEDLVEGCLVAVKRVLNVFDSEVRAGGGWGGWAGGFTAVACVSVDTTPFYFLRDVWGLDYVR